MAASAAQPYFGTHEVQTIPHRRSQPGPALAAGRRAALVGCASTQPASRYAGAASAASSDEVPLQAVTSGLFTSGQPAPSQWASIRSSGVTTVINLCLDERSEEHTSELQSLMRISYAVFCLKKKKKNH